MLIINDIKPGPILAAHFGYTLFIISLQNPLIHGSRTMRHAKLTMAAKVAAFALACGLYGTASAQIVQGVSLGAQAVVDQFNNGGRGQTFDYTRYRIQNPFPIAHKVTFIDKTIDLSAYGSDWYFSAMRAAPNTTVNDGYDGKGQGRATARLDYNPYRGTTSAYNNSSILPTTLSVGAAYLYIQWAVYGRYGGPAMHNDYWKAEVQAANTQFINAWGILGNQDRIRLGTGSGLGVSLWNSSNPVLQDLMRLNSSISYWLAPYDPDKLYTEIGYFSVFVMNNTRSDGMPLMNMLFAANMIPEPETYAMMLAGLGLIGVIARRRRSKSL